MNTTFTKRELDLYSFARAIQASFPNSKATGLEAQASQIACREFESLHGLAATGAIVIPPAVLGYRSESRALSATTANAGGYAALEKSGAWIDYLPGRSVCMFLGGEFITDIAGSLSFAKVATLGEPGFYAEGTGPSQDTGMAFKRASSTPKRVVAKVAVSKQLLTQSASAEENLKRTFAEAIAAAIDKGALVGIGGVEPLGIMNTPGVTDLTGGTADQAKLNAIEAAVFSAKTPMLNGGAYAIGTGARTTFKSTLRATYGSERLLETRQGADWLNGHTCRTSNFLGDTQAIFGDWSCLTVCQFGGLEIVSDPFSMAAANIVVVTVAGYFDVVVKRPDAFAILKTIA